MQSLWGNPFLEPFARLSRQFAALVPKLLTVLLILIVGAAVAAVVRYLVSRLLASLRFDALAERSGLATTIERTRVFRSPSDFAGRLVQGFLWLIIILAALTAVDSSLTDALVARFLSYVPALVTAALILLLGSATSKFLARSALLAAVNAQWPGARVVAGGVRVLVMSLAVAIALDELHIGRTVILVSFSILFAGIVIAGAIAFGLGARELARRWLHAKFQQGLAEEDDQSFRHL